MFSSRLCLANLCLILHALVSNHLYASLFLLLNRRADSIEEFVKDQTSFSQYLRNASRQNAQHQAFLAKRVR